MLTDAVHVDMLDYGGPGAYATTTMANADRAEIALQTRVRNDSRSRGRVAVVASLVDTDGRC